MRSTFKVLFYLKRNAPKKNGLVPVMCRITVNGKSAKASYQVKTGDIIEIAFGQRTMKVEVLEIAEHALKADAAGMYREIL